MKFGNGCVKSKLDGNEKIYEYKKIDIPEKFSYISVMPPILNQGDTSKCVCYALTSYLDWRKNQFEGDNNGGQFNIDSLYAIRADKNANGMEIKEALKFLRHNGLNGAKIGDYAMVKSTIALKHAIIANGPCPIALPVKSDDDEFWNGSNLEGGHCVLAVGYNKNGFIIRNSWGSSYGEKGYGLLPYEDFNKVIECWTII